MYVNWNSLGLKLGDKTLLSGLSGRIEEGECLAIMGPSGAGKTCFLGVISGEKTGFTGSVNCDKHQLPSKRTRRSIGYVRQYECFLNYLTPREHLFYQKKLFDPTDNDEHILESVDQTLHNFHLVKCSNTVIGNPLKNKGLSAGERKRLAIATEVFWKPRLLLLDEPTSNLDHYSAQAVLRCLKGIQEEGITIIMTIHQPSFRSYSLFNKVMVMSEGRALYFGSSDPTRISESLPGSDETNSELTNAFNRLDPNHIPPHECLIEIASDPEHQLLKETLLQQCKRVNQHTEDLSISEDQEAPTFYRVKRGFWIELKRCYHLSYRDFLNSKRNPMVIRIRICQNIFLALLVCLLYSGRDKGQHSVQNITGAMFFIIMNMVFSNSFSVLRIFSQHLNVFKREYSKRWYSLTSYFIAKTTSDIIFQVFNPIIFFTPVYWIVGLRNSVSAYLYSLLTLEILCLCACSWGYLIASASPGSDIVSVISPTLLLPFLIAGGFLVNSTSLPVYISWFADLSFFRYAFENLMIQEWSGREVLCLRSREECLYSNGDEVLKLFSVDPNNFWINLLSLIVILFGFRILALITLWGKTQKF